MPVIASPLALQALLVLAQRGPEGATLREVARSAGVRDSSAQHALAVLVEDSVVRAEGRGRQRRYRLNASDLSSDLLRLARHYLPREQILATLVRADPGVEFAGLEDGRLMVVFSERATAEQRLRCLEAIRLLGPQLAVEQLQHDDLVRRLFDEPELRERAARSKILVGSIPRSFPDRLRLGGRARARPLGRPHPSLRLPSRRALRRLAERFGLAELRLFGSAVRSDFAPDSDVDVVARPAPGTRLGLSDLVALEHELEEIFDRDVDVLTPDSLSPRLRERIDREGVVVHG